MDIIEANNYAFLVGLVKKQAAQIDAVKLACATIENLTVPKADSSWHIAGEKSAVAKVRAALEKP